MRYVALLRGINVGGNNRVPMQRLRELANELCWADPTTYIASGNLVFDAPRTRTTLLADQLEDALEHEFGFRCRTLVLTASQVTRIAEAVPAEWTNDTDQRCDVVYLLDRVTAAHASELLEPRDGIDHVRLAPGALIWRVRRADATRSRLQRITTLPIYAQSTIRNVNTARKLAELVAS